MVSIPNPVEAGPEEKGHAGAWNCTANAKLRRVSVVLNDTHLCTMPRASRRRSAPPVLRHTNYRLLSIGVVAVAIGFVLMYMESSLNGVLSLYVSPLLIMGGYAEIIYALLWRPSDADQPEPSSAADSDGSDTDA